MKQFDDVAHLETIMKIDTKRYTLLGYVNGYGDVSKVVFSVEYEGETVVPIFVDVFTELNVILRWSEDVFYTLESSNHPYAPRVVPTYTVGVYMTDGSIFNTCRTYFYGSYARPLTQVIPASIHMKYIYQSIKRWYRKRK